MHYQPCRAPAILQACILPFHSHPGNYQASSIQTTTTQWHNHPLSFQTTTKDDSPHTQRHTQQRTRLWIKYRPPVTKWIKKTLMDRDQTEYIAESIMQHKDIAEKKTNKKAQQKDNNRSIINTNLKFLEECSLK